MSSQFANLNWPQRLQIVSSLNVSSEHAANVMGVSVEDLEYATKKFTPDATFNVEPFAPHFSFATKIAATPAVAVSKRRRGRKSSKIKDALNAVSTTKQPLKQFCERHSVSEHCMRQHARFAPDRKDIVVRKDKESGQIMIWSEPDVAE